MPKNQYQDIVAKATAYVKANLDQSLSIPEIAAHVGFSIAHVRNAFRKILNQSVLHTVQSERIAKSKVLLQKTQLDITQVAFESGFENYAGFHRVFRQSTGMTPSLFRERVAQLGDMPVHEEGEALEKKEEWFNDHFRAQELGAHWKLLAGDWKQSSGCLNGKGPDNVVSFLKPLPENCRITLDVKADPDLHMSLPGVFIRLLDESRSKWYCEFTIATEKRAVGQLMHYRIGRQWNQNARITECEWHAVILEMREEHLSLIVDGVRIFSLRDSFPSAYANRCYLDMGSYHCNVSFREFSIQNLGFMPVIPPIRQGDTLYNSGLFENAMSFYMRYLQAGAANDTEIMELRYKIGMCHLRSGALSQARGWIDKVVSLQEDRFWAEQAQLSLLELFWKIPDLPSLQEHLGHCFANIKARDQTRVTTQFAVDDFVSRGFFAEADLLLRAWSSLESPGSYPQQVASAHLAEHSQRLLRFAEAEEILNELARTSAIEEVVLSSRISLMHLYNECGEINKSETLRMQLERDTSDSFFHARCRATQATNLRAKGEFENALKAFGSVLAQNPVEQSFSRYAKIHIAHILCCMGRLEEGRKALEEAHTLDPGFYPNSQHYLPFLLAEGNYMAAAESVLKDYRNSKELVSASAELGVKAGILYELANLHEEAKSIFKEVSQRFPNEQVRFFGQLAKVLMEDALPKDAASSFDNLWMGGKDSNSSPESVSLTLSLSKCERTSASSFDKLKMSAGETGKLHFITQMPYEHFRRSEMFYLVGLLKKKRGDNTSARALFELSVKDDPALRWPAFFARQRLATIRQAPIS